MKAKEDILSKENRRDLETNEDKRNTQSSMKKVKAATKTVKHDMKKFNKDN